MSQLFIKTLLTVLVSAFVGSVAFSEGLDTARREDRARAFHIMSELSQRGSINGYMKYNADIEPDIGTCTITASIKDKELTITTIFKVDESKQGNLGDSFDAIVMPHVGKPIVKSAKISDLIFEDSDPSNGYVEVSNDLNMIFRDKSLIESELKLSHKAAGSNLTVSLFCDIGAEGN